MNPRLYFRQKGMALQTRKGYKQLRFITSPRVLAVAASRPSSWTMQENKVRKKRIFYDGVHLFMRFGLWSVTTDKAPFIPKGILRTSYLHDPTYNVSAAQGNLRIRR
jgi:hypothetical protein